MRTFILLALLLGSLASLTTHAAVYRCGGTFSDVPCGDDAEVHEVFGEGSESLKDLDRKAADTCLQGARENGLLGNPGSAQAQPVGKRKVALFDVRGRNVMAVYLTVAISEHNPETGAFMPPKQYDCVATKDLLRVLSISAQGGEE